MQFPFTLIIPAFLSTMLQGFLWTGYLFFIPWMDRIAMLWLSIAGVASGLIFLFIYRMVAFNMKPWSLPLVACSLIQFASITGSSYLALLNLGFVFGG